MDQVIGRAGLPWQNAWEVCVTVGANGEPEASSNPPPPLPPFSCHPLVPISPSALLAHTACSFNHLTCSRVQEPRTAPPSSSRPLRPFSAQGLGVGGSSAQRVGSAGVPQRAEAVPMQTGTQRITFAGLFGGKPSTPAAPAAPAAPSAAQDAAAARAAALREAQAAKQRVRAVLVPVPVPVPVP
eukprot:129799-Hanusia_phi.AAC.1